MEFTASILIAATPAQVWAIYSDVERWPEWTKSVTSVAPLEPGPLRLGQRVRIRQPKLPVAVWTTTELDDGRSWTWVATGPGVRTTATHTVQEHPDGAEVFIQLTQGGLLGGLVGKLTAGLTDRYLDMEAEGLKARAEAN